MTDPAALVDLAGLEALANGLITATKADASAPHGHAMECRHALILAGAAFDAAANPATVLSLIEQIRSLQAERDALREALERQTDNMSFLLNRVDAMAWHDKFESELTEDRTALAMQGEGS